MTIQPSDPTSRAGPVDGSTRLMLKKILDEEQRLADIEAGKHTYQSIPMVECPHCGRATDGTVDYCTNAGCEKHKTTGEPAPTNEEVARAAAAGVTQGPAGKPPPRQRRADERLQGSKINEEDAAQGFRNVATTKRATDADPKSLARHRSREKVLEGKRRAGRPMGEIGRASCRERV